MKQSFEFGAYIPESFLDSMNHAEAYITARILFWLRKQEKVYKTDEDLADECHVSCRSLKAWKQKIKEKHYFGIDFYVQEKPQKVTFYTKKGSGNFCPMVEQDLPEGRANSTPPYIEHKTQHKPPISPKGTFPNFIWEEKTIHTIFQHLFTSWIDEQTSVEIHEASKLVFVGVKNSFRKTKLEGLMLTNKEFNQIKQTHGLTVEVVNNDPRKG